VSKTRAEVDRKLQACGVFVVVFHPGGVVVMAEGEWSPFAVVKRGENDSGLCQEVKPIASGSEYTSCP